MTLLSFRARWQFRFLNSAVAVFVCAVVFILLPSAANSQQPAPPTLTLTQIEGLIAHGVPDSTMSAQIQRRGLAFIPTPAILDELLTKGAGPLVISSVQQQISPGSYPPQSLPALPSPSTPNPLSSLGDAKRQIPIVLQAIFRSLNQGDPQSVARYLSPQILSNPGQLDAICRPFSYRAHYIEAIIERPGPAFEAWVRVLYKPFEEHAVVMTFRQADGDFQLVQRSDSVDDWFASTKETAIQDVRNFLYAAKAQQADVLAGLVGPGIDAATFTSSPCWQELLPRIVRVQSANAFPDQFKGLKIHVRTNAAVDTNNFFHSEILSDFWLDRIGDDYKIVAANLINNPNNSIMADNSIPACHDVDRNAITQFESPGLEHQTLVRFGLAEPGAASTQVPNPQPAPAASEPSGVGSSQTKSPTMVSAGIAEGMLLQRTNPIYPPIARAARITGTVVLQATISTQGTIESLHVVSGPAMLQQSALDAVKQWRYRPYLINNVPVAVETTVNVIFSLNP